MIGAGIVEVDRALDQPLAQHMVEELRVGLRVAGHGRDMV